MNVAQLGEVGSRTESAAIVVAMVGTQETCFVCMQFATMDQGRVHTPGQVIRFIRVLSAPSMAIQPNGVVGQSQGLEIEFVSAITLIVSDCPLFAARVPRLL